MNDIISSLEFVTGFNLSLNNGLLDVSDVNNFTGGSNIARNYIINAIKNKQIFTYNKYKTEYDFETGNISISPKQIGRFTEYTNRISNNETMGFGISITEELIHREMGLSHTEKNFGDIGTVTQKTNDIRNELGLDLRMSYLSFDVTIGESTYSYFPFDKDSRDIINRYVNKNDYFIDINTMEGFLKNYKYIK